MSAATDLRPLSRRSAARGQHFMANHFTRFNKRQMRRGVKGKGKGTREAGEGRGGSSAAETSSQRVSTDTLGGQPLFIFYFFTPAKLFIGLNRRQQVSAEAGGRRPRAEAVGIPPRLKSSLSLCPS